MSDNIAPFDRQYVMRTTFRHMIKSINISIDKTVSRMKDFTDDHVKNAELLSTLSDLHAVRKSLELYQKLNPDQFKGINSK
jgi:hypothetical protein